MTGDGAMSCEKLHVNLALYKTERSNNLYVETGGGKKYE